MKPINGTEKVPIDAQFERSVKLVRSLPSDGPLQVSYASAAKVYSYFKQAKFGPCKETKPNFWDVIKKAKWEAWTKLGDMPKETAMTLYINEIKQQFKEFMKTAEFDEEDCDFGDTVVSFCNAVDLPCPKQLEKYNVNKEQAAVSTNGDSHHNPVKINGNGTLITETESIAVLKAKASKDTDRTSVKKVEFDDPRKDAVSGDESGDDVYCDSIDPSEASVLFATHLNGSQNDSVATVVSTNQIEDHIDRLNGIIAESAPLRNGTEFQDHKEKPKSLRDVDSSSKRGRHLPIRNVGIGRHRQPRPSSSRGMHHRHTDRSSSLGPSEDIECDSNAMADALRNFDSSGSGKEPSDETDSECSALSSLTDDRIMIALKRLQRDIHVVSERIAAIEYSICRHRNNTSSWMDFNNPSMKTMLFFLAWPVLVNVLFFYWRRRKQRPR